MIATERNRNIKETSMFSLMNRSSAKDFPHVYFRLDTYIIRLAIN